MASTLLLAASPAPRDNRHPLKHQMFSGLETCDWPIWSQEAWGNRQPTGQGRLYRLPQTWKYLCETSVDLQNLGKKLKNQAGYHVDEAFSKCVFHHQKIYHHLWKGCYSSRRFLRNGLNRFVSACRCPPPNLRGTSTYTTASVASVASSVHKRS